MTNSKPDRVKLISSDGQEFTIKKEIAVFSKTLNMLFNSSSNYIESEAEAICLPIHSKCMRRIVEFLEYKASDKNVDEFVITDEETVDLLDAAAYLRI
ncbi:elongin-C (ELOC) [Vairimorpha necatrix]|uniref:Elongin-C n=1 Tax=Vairimorpha necatrix TaxID=6039 RepID=A0AAX4JG69_9MICR